MIKHKLTSPISSTQAFIITAKELSRLAHLPSEQSVGISGIDYKTNTLDSEVPSGAKEYEPITKKERKSNRKN